MNWCFVIRFMIELYTPKSIASVFISWLGFFCHCFEHLLAYVFGLDFYSIDHRYITKVLFSLFWLSFSFFLIILTMFRYVSSFYTICLGKSFISTFFLVYQWYCSSVLFCIKGKKKFEIFHDKNEFSHVNTISIGQFFSLLKLNETINIATINLSFASEYKKSNIDFHFIQ